MTDAPKDGRVVEVVTPRLGGGEPAIELFFVALDDDPEAVEAVRSKWQYSAETKVVALTKLSANTVKTLGMRRGEIWPA
jgi:hypothetical protein